MISVDIPGFDKDLFLFSLKKKRTHFRVNTLRISPMEFEEVAEFSFEHVLGPFYVLKDKIKLGKTWEYASGLIHIQSLSSSLIPTFFDYSRLRYVLDMTAAPGGKATEIAEFMKGKGVVVANDKKERLSSIRANALRLGTPNLVLSAYDARNLSLKEAFDGVLLDAPCTALGSHLNAWKRITKGHVRSIARVQKVMILRAFDALKKGGQLIYSTCSITKEENEDVISFLLDKRERAKLVPLKCSLPHERGIEMPEAIRFYPWHLDSEGFFVAKVVKT